MSVTSTASSVHPPTQDQGELVVHDRRVTVEGMYTQYLEAGVGSVLLLVHGHEQSATSWRWVIPALARTHRVLALSLPGHGETDPATGDYAPGADQARFVAAFLDSLHIDPPLDLVGHSAGGALALRLALADPQRIRSMTLVSSAGLGREVHPLLALDTLPIIGELAIMISRLPGGDWGRTTMSTAMLFAQPWRAPAEFITEQHALARRPGQLEASTATARALFGPTGQRQTAGRHATRERAHYRPIHARITDHRPLTPKERHDEGHQPTILGNPTDRRRPAHTPRPRSTRRAAAKPRPAVAAQRTPPASPDQRGQPSTRRSTTQHADRTR
jgi:pimeloyl-ACP methyl ester carboxylesterase